MDGKETQDANWWKSVLAQAVQQFPKNVTLWIKYLLSLLVEEEPLFAIDVGHDNTPAAEAKPATVPEEFLVQFKKSVNCVGNTSQAVGLWETVIDHYANVSRQNHALVDIVEDLYQQALKQEPPVANYFKPKLLSWIAEHKGT